MSSLGINVGNTGGNMLAEAMIIARGVGMGRQAIGGGGFGRGAKSNSPSGGNNGGFMSGGLAGAVSRKVNSSAISSATNQGGNAITSNAFNSSMAKGGDFANNIIGSVAKGNITQTGSITGSKASTALTSYMGEVGNPNAPSYTGVEIGGGRIMGSEITPNNPDGIPFGMYSTEQYMPPEKGSYSIVESADESKWYKQYAADTVEKTPYQDNETGTISYNETIVQKLPPVPRRKDKV